MDSEGVVELRRKLTLDELQTAYEAMVMQLERMAASGHPLGVVVFPPNVLPFLTALNEAGQLQGFTSRTTGELIGIIGYSFEPVWWTNGECCLKEQMVVCVDPECHGFGRVALAWLEVQAEVNNCGIIETGSAFSENPRLLENLYVRKGGYQFSYPNFVKVR